MILKAAAQPALILNPPRDGATPTELEADDGLLTGSEVTQLDLDCPDSDAGVTLTVRGSIAPSRCAQWILGASLSRARGAERLQVPPASIGDALSEFDSGPPTQVPQLVNI